MTDETIGFARGGVYIWRDGEWMGPYWPANFYLERLKAAYKRKQNRDGDGDKIFERILCQLEGRGFYKANGRIRTYTEAKNHQSMVMQSPELQYDLERCGFPNGIQDITGMMPHQGHFPAKNLLSKDESKAIYKVNGYVTSNNHFEFSK